MRVRAAATGLPPILPAASFLRAFDRPLPGRLLAWLVALLFLGNVVLSFPGTMMTDSDYQYAEAMSGHYSDWHPPVMAWLWSLMRRVEPGPAPMFLLHLVLYWGGIALFADAMRRLGRRGPAIAIAFAGAFPPFVFLNANVIKDVAMAVCFLCAAGAIFWHRAQGRRIASWTAAGVALLLGYGLLVRTNSAFAFGPLVVWAIAPARWLRTLRLAIASLVVAVLAVPASQAVNTVLFHPLHRSPLDSLLMFDLAGTAAQAHDPSLLAPRAAISQDELARCYTPFWWDSFSAWGPCGRFVRRPDTEHAAYSDGLVAQWLRTVASHPLAYLEHRAKHLNSELYFAVPLKHMRLAPEFRGDTGHPTPEVFSPSQVRWDLVKRNPVTWPAAWVAWAAVLLVFLGRRGRHPAVLAARVLVMSALAYSLAYAVIGVATDLRYHYWSMLATFVASLVVAPQLARAWRARAPVLRFGLAALAAVVAIGLATRLADFQAWVS